RRLVEKGYPSAIVEVRTESDEAQRLRLVFDINAGKRTEFVWSGDDPGKDLRRSIERAWDGRVPESFLLPDLARRARAGLAARRYYLARVDARVEESEESRRVVFDVARGPRGERVEILFEGNEVLEQKTLRTILPHPTEPALFLLLERRAELERGIRLRYASEGYLDASIGELAESYDPRTGAFRITVPVEEGAATRVTDVTFDGSTVFDEAKLGAAIGVASGEPVDFPAIRRGEARIRTLYREDGFPDVRLRTELSRTVDGLVVAVGIEEGARARVGHIRVVGNVRTRESVVRNELTFEEGDPVRITDFQESQKRLYDLGILRTADVRVEATQEGQLRQDVIVQVNEKPDLDVNYGIRYNVLTSEQALDAETASKDGGFEGVVRVNLVNPAGFGSNAGLSVFFQKDYQLYRGTFRLPVTFGERIITELVLDTEREENRLDIPGLDLRRDRVTFQQTKKLRDFRYDKLALQWNVSYARYRGQTIDRGTGAVIAFETNRPRFGLSFIDDRRDSFANPTRGRFWNVTLQYTPEIWGSEVSYYRLYGQLFYYHPIWGRLVWASGVRLGVAPGEFPLLLIDDRFQAGGASSVRGFEQNTLGPSVTVPETGEQVFIGGQAVGVFNQELRFPLYRSLQGGVFWDVGNVFARVSDFRIPDLRQSLGAGLRYVLSVGAIRLDWARVIDPREGESASRFHFSFGFAF
ncbi:MAG TPA: BamA/TamA family outer membrane protein, partial [Vicinamibacteria bacterium]|nr:BamA/TamA family outer membrane protein [Vicinamibacteria bacterium]